MASIFDDVPTPSPSNTSGSNAERGKRSKNRIVGLSVSELSRGKRHLVEYVEEAFLTLEQAMEYADWPTAVKAATALLDRAGFGPRSSVEVNTSTTDFSDMTREQLADHAHKIAMMLKSNLPPKSEPQTPIPPSTTIN